MSEDKQADPSRTSALSPSVEPGVWRYARASRASVIVDAADYFAFMQEAMLKSRRRILLIGWDFDTRIHLERGRRWWQRAWKRGYPARLGSFIAWLARHRKKLDIRILKWSVGALSTIGRASMWWDLARWVRHRRINFRFDTAHPVGCTHHQKIAVLDNKVTVCGGIDMTDQRWDTREHKEHDPRRKTPHGRQYGPWHDAAMMMEGEIATALAELGDDRWTCAGGNCLPEVEEAPGSPWPEALEPQFENVEIGIARTRAAYRDWDAVNEIERLYLEQIGAAKRFIYAESQYFASRSVAEAIIARLQEDDPPEIVIVHPSHADGWLEQQAMDHARDLVAEAVEAADGDEFFEIYVPYTGETPIYVHAKLMIVDDEVVRTNDRIRMVSLEVLCGTKHQPPKAELELEIDDEVKCCKATGDGPVDASFNAIKKLFPHEARLQLYQVHAVTHGTDAQAKVTVRLEEDGRTVIGTGADTDTMVASVKAYVNALNKLLLKRQKTAPEALSA